MTPLLLVLFAPAHPPRVIVEVPPPVVVQAPPVVVLPAPVAVSVAEFAKCFVPVPGTHRVVLIHPKSNCPVEVCFTLPECGRPPKVSHNRHHLEFDFGKTEVDIRFRHNGTVDVKGR